jgi:hypothetical protein
VRGAVSNFLTQVTTEAGTEFRKEARSASPGA